MAHRFMSRRAARLRASLTALGLTAAFGACDDTSSLEPTSTTPEGVAPVAGPSLAGSSFAGGIPIGLFRQPTSEFGSRFNGAMRTIAPQYLRSELAAIKARGGKVVVNLSGADHYYKDSGGHFSLTKWKARVDRFKSIDFSSYITDGTVIAHYLIDEPQDPANWNNRLVSPATLDEMAQYSKQRWPGMPTVVRSSPDYLDNLNGSYRYLDAAWAQYVAARWPNPDAFVNDAVARAKSKGLGLIVGLNVIDGGPKKGPMTASQVKSYGQALLSNSYPCAFLSWQYRSSYLTSSVRDAMSDLRRMAENRSTKSCRN